MASTWRWGTITASDGGGAFSLQIDGDSKALPFQPDTLVDPLTLKKNDRVRIQINDGRALIIGRAGGTGLPAWDWTSPDVTDVDSRFTAATPGFARRLGMCAFNIDLTPNVNIAAGNISNIALFTLPAGFRPARVAPATIPDINATVQIAATGVTSLASLEYAWNSGELRNLRAHYFLA